MAGNDERTATGRNPNAVVIDYAEWSRMLAEVFPEVPAAYDKYSTGLLHCELGTFARLTDEAIEAGDSERVAKHFVFIDQARKQADDFVENAIDVSYIEYLAWREWTDLRYQAFRRMPRALRRVLHESDGEGRWA
jgi:hypothetical protein